MARFAFRDSLSLTSIQGNMMSTDGLSGHTFMQIFEFGSLAEIGVDTKFGQKQPVRTCRLFSKF